jgi:hypothetical protein
LDNTLWKTAPTIEDANNALHDYLIERNLQYFGFSALNRYQSRVETIMRILMNENPSKYCCMTEHNIPSPQNVRDTMPNSRNQLTPVHLTVLRKDAIETVVRQSGYDEDDIDVINEIVEDAFDYWMQSRQISIKKNLANHVIETLRTIKSFRCNDKQIIVGAITDGNSNPILMDVFTDYFDFCVNAETVGIGKPSRQIFLYAAKNYILPMLNITKNKFSNKSFASSGASSLDIVEKPIESVDQEVDVYKFAEQDFPQQDYDFMTDPSYGYSYSAKPWMDEIWHRQDDARTIDRTDNVGFTNEEIESMLGPWWVSNKWRNTTPILLY